MRAACVFVLLTQSFAFAQPDTLWSRFYGDPSGQRPHDVIETQDGGFFVVGEWFPPFSYSPNVYCVRTDSTGDTLWTLTRYDSTEMFAYAAVETEAGDFFIAGYMRNSRDEDYAAFSARVTADGVFTGYQTYRLGEMSFGLDVVAFGSVGYLIVGRIGDWMGSADGLLMRVDVNGGLLWSRRYGENEQDDIFSCISKSEYGFLIGGWTEPSSRDMWFVRIDPAGNVLFQNAYGDNRYDAVSGVGQLADGNYFVSGETVEFHNDQGSTHTFKLSNSQENEGEIIWDSEYTNHQYFRYGGAVATPDGGVAIAGSRGVSSAFNGNVVVYKLDEDGNMEWERTYSRSEFGYTREITSCQNGGFAVVASPIIPEYNTEDVWLLRIGVESGSAAPQTPQILAEGIALYAYPNPFNSSTTISFSLPYPADVRLQFFDALGRSVGDPVSERFSAGAHAVMLAPGNWASGTYFAALNYYGMSASKKIVLVK